LFIDFREKLEEQYRICETCNRHLARVLREKKKLVIGAKFLEFVLRGAKKLQEPYLLEIRQHFGEKKKKRINRLALLLTIINIVCIARELTVLKKEYFENIFGETIGPTIFFGISHVIALGRALTSCAESLLENKTIERAYLFAKTIFMMTIYSLGLTLPHTNKLSFKVLYMSIYPYQMILTLLVYKIYDSLKISRFTFLLLSWSAIAGGLLDYQNIIEPENFMVSILHYSQNVYRTKNFLIFTDIEYFFEFYFNCLC